MLSMQDLKTHFSPKCVTVSADIFNVCQKNWQVSSFLSQLMYWQEQVEKSTPERNGWVWKTANDMKNEFGFSRKVYEKVRGILLELGIIQYRRGGVHGKSHYRVNKEQLLKLVYDSKGQKMPENVSKVQIDCQNSEVPNWLPIQEWNAFVTQIKASKGKVTNKQKKVWIEQLAKLRKEFDLKLVINQSILKGWFAFYPLNKAPTYATTSRSTAYDNDPKAKAIAAAIAAQAERERKEQAAQKAAQQTLRNESEIERGKKQAPNLLAYLDTVIKKSIK